MLRRGGDSSDGKGRGEDLLWVTVLDRLETERIEQDKSGDQDLGQPSCTLSGRDPGQVQAYQASDQKAWKHRPRVCLRPTGPGNSYERRLDKGRERAHQRLGAQVIVDPPVRQCMHRRRRIKLPISRASGQRRQPRGQQPHEDVRSSLL